MKHFAYGNSPERFQGEILLSWLSKTIAGRHCLYLHEVYNVLAKDWLFPNLSSLKNALYHEMFSSHEREYPAKRCSLLLKTKKMEKIEILVLDINFQQVSRARENLGWFLHVYITILILFTDFRVQIIQTADWIRVITSSLAPPTCLFRWIMQTLIRGIAWSKNSVCLHKARIPVSW